MPAIFAAVIVLSGYGQQTLTEPCAAASLVEVGDVAHCSGTLVPDAEAKVAVACVGVDLPRCEKRRAFEAEAARIRLATAERMLDDGDAYVDRLLTLLSAATAVVPPARPWYEHPGFVAVVSGVAVGGLVLLSVYAAGSL